MNKKEEKTSKRTDLHFWIDLSLLIILIILLYKGF